MAAHHEQYTPLDVSGDPTNNEFVPEGIPVQDVYGNPSNPQIYSTQGSLQGYNQNVYPPQGQVHQGNQNQERLNYLEQDRKRQNGFVVTNWVMIGLSIFGAVSIIGVIFVFAIFVSENCDGAKDFAADIKNRPMGPNGETLGEGLKNWTKSFENGTNPFENATIPSMNGTNPFGEWGTPSTKPTRPLGGRPSRPPRHSQTTTNSSNQEEDEQPPLDCDQVRSVAAWGSTTVIVIILLFTAANIAYHYIGIKFYNDKNACGMQCLHISYIVFAVLSCMSCNLIGLGVYIYLANMAGRLRYIFEEMELLGGSNPGQQSRAVVSPQPQNIQMSRF